MTLWLYQLNFCLFVCVSHLGISNTFVINEINSDLSLCGQSRIMAGNYKYGNYLELNAAWGVREEEADEAKEGQDEGDKNDESSLEEDAFVDHGALETISMSYTSFMVVVMRDVVPGFKRLSMAQRRSTLAPTHDGKPEALIKFATCLSPIFEFATRVTNGKAPVLPLTIGALEIELATHVVNE